MKNKTFEEIRKGNIKPVGGLCLSNYGGLEVYSIIYGIEDYIISGFNYGDGPKDLKQTKVYTSNSGRAYIRRYNARYYLDTISRY